MLIFSTALLKTPEALRKPKLEPRQGELAREVTLPEAYETAQPSSPS
jgi:hypothetical protein